MRDRRSAPFSKEPYRWQSGRPSGRYGGRIAARSLGKAVRIRVDLLDRMVAERRLIAKRRIFTRS